MIPALSISPNRLLILRGEYSLSISSATLLTCTLLTSPLRLDRDGERLSSSENATVGARCVALGDAGLSPLGDSLSPLGDSLTPIGDDLPLLGDNLTPIRGDTYPSLIGTNPSKSAYVPLGDNLPKLRGDKLPERLEDVDEALLEFLLKMEGLKETGERGV